ncbi:MAG: hypothetical protein ACYC61_28120 [Isosphaeraceae bacterium]
MTQRESSTATPSPPPSPRRRRWQVGLRTVILLTAAVAVWLAYALDRRWIADFTTRIASLSPLAHELVVDDAGRIAVVKREELWFDDDRCWDVYIPTGRTFRLCMATRGLPEITSPAPEAKARFPTPAASAPLSPGRHVVTVEQVRDGDGWRVDAESDGARLVSVTEPKGWDSGNAFSSGYYEVSEQTAPEQPVILFHRQFMGLSDNQGSATVPDGNYAGIMLWIEPDTSAAAGGGQGERGPGGHSY